MDWHPLIQLAQRQYGVVHVRQARELGIDPRALQRRLDEGWERLHRGVYALPGSPPTLQRACMAAQLAIGDGVITSWTAANLWGLTDRQALPVRVIVPHGSHRPALRGVRVMQSALIEPSHVTQLAGLRLAVPARALCDVAADCEMIKLAELVALAVQERLTVLGQIEEMRVALGNRPGTGKLSRALALLASDGKTDSKAERDIRRMLRRNGFRPAAGVYRLALPDGSVVNLDIAFPEQRVAIEVDGFAWHRTPEQLRRDHERQNRIQAAGWIVLRVNYAVLANPGPFLVQLRQVLSERSTDRYDLNSL